MSNKESRPSARSSSEHKANPPGNPVASRQSGDDKARQQQFAAEEEQRAEHALNINKQNVPIKQPNKATNNS
jgi:hypothetical protein